jgi:hypothetical protein
MRISVFTAAVGGALTYIVILQSVEITDIAVAALIAYDTYRGSESVPAPLLALLLAGRR